MKDNKFNLIYFLSGLSIGMAITVVIFKVMIPVNNIGLLRKGDNEKQEEIWQHLSSQIIAVRTDVDVIKGKLKVYENLPIDLRARIEILETRYENLLFFKKEINEKEEEGE